MVNVMIPGPRKRMGAPPLDELTISYTKRHGLGWALFHPGSATAYDAGGFALPDGTTREDMVAFALARTRAHMHGHWVNLDRYDYLLFIGRFPYEVREVDKAGAVRRRVRNGPAILSVLHRKLAMVDLVLRPSRECPYVHDWSGCLLDGRLVAVRFKGDRG